MLQILVFFQRYLTEDADDQNALINGTYLDGALQR